MVRICENGKYLGSIINDSVIRCDKTINTTDSLSTNVASSVSKSVSNKFCKRFF